MKFLHNYKNVLTGLFAFSIFFSCIVFLQISYDKSVRLKNFYELETEKYVLPASVIRYLSFGFNNVLADFYWITIIQDLSEWNHNNTFYIEEYRNLVTLDPKFSYPYLFGILTTTSKKYPESPDKFEPIANIGIQNLPYNWEIPFYLASSFNLIKNYPKASNYIELAITRPIVPTAVQTLYNSYIKRNLAEQSTSQAFIKTIYDTTDSETTKKILKQNMAINDITQALESVVRSYKQQFGIYPKSLSDLVNKNLLRISPELEQNFHITIDDKNGNIEVLSKNK